ncbi:hypothetical protein ACIGNX_24425 [Actinosynnema sp. NPDC053489]|uniref:hypothetical protein n=1 Tax=Actinosynnema sp. NPDC053489 TaxID=3363916 RepID=UPI0037CB145D
MGRLAGVRRGAVLAGEAGVLGSAGLVGPTRPTGLRVVRRGVLRRGVLRRVGWGGREALWRRLRTPGRWLGWREALRLVVGWGGRRGHLAFLSTTIERNVPPRARRAHPAQRGSDAGTRQYVTAGST